MKTVKVNLNSIDSVKKFVNIVSGMDNTNLDLVSGRYIIDAKSIMGIFSLDLSNSIELHIHCKEADGAEKVIEAIKEFIV